MFGDKKNRGIKLCCTSKRSKNKKDKDKKSSVLQETKTNPYILGTGGFGRCYAFNKLGDNKSTEGSAIRDCFLCSIL